MNAHIAQLIIDRIVAADLPFVHRYAGLVRAAKYVHNKKTLVVPVAAGLQAGENCDPVGIDALVPDEHFRSVLFIEGDAMPTRTQDRIPGVLYTSRLRVVVWIDCKQMGGDPDCAADAAMNLISAIGGSARTSYNTPLFKGVRHIVSGGTTRGADVFSAYTFDEVRSQYLLPPFDAFAIDVITEFRVSPGCEDQLLAEVVGCWTPPTIAVPSPPTSTCRNLRICGTPDTGDVPTWDGSKWTPEAPTGGGGATLDETTNPGYLTLPSGGIIPIIFP